MAAQACALEAAGLRLSYPGRSVLHDVDLSLAPGEIFTLLGPNGAGKTTLIRAITGRLTPDVGTVRVSGYTAGAAEARRRLGLVPQEVAVYPHLTPRENLTVFGRLAGLRGRGLRRAVAEGLATARLEGRADELCRHLSGGYQRRVNVAAAILHRPALLLLDEPTVGVDAAAREAIHGVIGDLAAGGMAVLMTTHDLHQAQRLSHRVGFLVAGRLEREGEPATLLRTAFGDTRTLRLRLDGPPESDQAAELRAAGLTPLGEDGRQWQGRCPADLQTAGGVLARLAPVQGQIASIQLEQPDLADLYHHLTGGGEGQP